MSKPFDTPRRLCIMRLPAIALVAFLLAGCSNARPQSDVEAQAIIGDLQWEGVFDVRAASTESNPGFMRIAYEDGFFAIDNEKELGLASHILVDDQRVVTSTTGKRWVLWTKGEAIARSEISEWVLVWDLKTVLQAKSTVLRLGDEPGGVEATATLRLGAHDVDFTYKVLVRGDRIVEATISGKDLREGPHVIRPSSATLRFATTWPDALTILDGGDVTRGDEASREAHGFVAGLIEQYCRTRAGQIPPSVDAQTLRVELTLSGQPWPMNAYDGQPLAAGDDPGDFTWTRETANRGTYEGNGWDGPIQREDYGPTRCS